MNKTTTDSKRSFFNMLRKELSSIASQWRVRTMIFVMLVVQCAFIALFLQQTFALSSDGSAEHIPSFIYSAVTSDQLGFDTAFLIVVPMILLGALIGAKTYRLENLSDASVHNNHRFRVFLAKILAVIIIILLLSLIAIILPVIIARIVLVVPDPFVFTPVMFEYLLCSLTEITLLTTLSFAIALLTSSSIVPLLFLIPQIYGGASFVLAYWNAGVYLPYTAGRMIGVLPNDPQFTLFKHNPLQGTLILGAWCGVFLFLGWTRVIMARTTQEKQKVQANTAQQGSKEPTATREAKITLPDAQKSAQLKNVEKPTTAEVEVAPVKQEESAEVSSKATTKKKATTSKATTKKKATTSKATTKKKATTSKATTKKKATTSKTTTKKKATTSKATTKKKATTSKATTKKKATTSKATTKKKATTSKATTKKKTKTSE